MPEVAEMAVPSEPVESTTAETTVETPVEGGEASETVNDVDSSGQKQPLTEKTQTNGKLKLSEIAKSKADALRAIDPALPAAMQKAGHELGRFYGEFPGGIKEAVALKTTLSEYGGVEGLKEQTEALTDYKALDQMFEKGDPQFMQRLAETLPEAFSQVMPAGLEHWKKADPEMYNHVQARVMVQTLDSFRASETLAAVWKGLEAGPAKDAIEQLWQKIDGYRTTADKAPERKTTPQNEALTKREQALAQREAQAMLAPVKAEGTKHIQTVTDREMAHGYQWDKADSDVQQAVRERIQQEVIKASEADKTFVRDFNRLKERGDSAGLTRLVTAFQDRVLPGKGGIIERAAKLFALRPKAAPVALTSKPAVAATNGNGKASQDFVRVSSQPSASQINYGAMGRNAEDMIMSGKAILKDGRRVQWA